MITKSTPRISMDSFYRGSTKKGQLANFFNVCILAQLSLECTGKIKIDIKGIDYDYEGEVDENGKLCGYGKVSFPINPD